MNTTRFSLVPRSLVLILAIFYLASLTFFSYGNSLAGAEPWQMAVNALLLSVPLVLLCFSIGVLAAAARQRRSQGTVDRRLGKFILWTPRIAGIAIVLFVALFALDVFSEGGSFWAMLGGFLIHASPAIVLAVALALAWRWSWVGAVLFSCGALFFLRFVLGGRLENLGNLLLFSGPMAAIAALFWVNWRWRKELRPG